MQDSKVKMLNNVENARQEGSVKEDNTDILLKTGSKVADELSEGQFISNDTVQEDNDGPEF